MSECSYPESSTKCGKKPALVLWLIAPVIGEMISGSTPLNEYVFPPTFLTLGMLYGSGAILLREVIIRWRKGWPSLLALGMAYGIYEEGLVVRSFFDPNWMDLDALGVYGRTMGVNWVWTQHLTVFHAVFSILASIYLSEVLFSHRRNSSWVGPKGLACHTVAFVVMLPLGCLLNRYDAPDIWLGLSWVAIALLILAAWFLPARISAKVRFNTPGPWRFFCLAFVGSFLHFFIVYVMAQQNISHFVVCMVLVTLLDLLVLWLILRWSGGCCAWDDRHRLALINGGLFFFLIFGPLTAADEYPIMYFSSPVIGALLWLLYWRINQQSKQASKVES